MVAIRSEDVAGSVATRLIAELSRELTALYPGETDGNFDPNDMAKPRCRFVVAWVGDEPAGCGALRPLYDAAIGEIKRMYVRPDFRRRGISKQLLLALEDAAVEFAYREVWLETGLLQPVAIGLYERMGYRRIPCYPPYTEDPMSVCYGKTLTSTDLISG